MATLPSSWQSVYGEFTHTQWRGYAGNWWLISKAQPEQTLRLKALRTFKFDDESRTKLTHKNLYDKPGVLTPTQREADGLWEQSWARDIDEAGYTADFTLRPGEATSLAPVRRLIALEEDAYVGACPLLPGAAATPEGAFAPPQWSIELFLRGGDGTRWSVGSVYAPSPSFGRTMTFLIQERWSESVPHDQGALDLERQPFLEPREGRLPEDPLQWLPGGGAGLSGRARCVEIGADGLPKMPVDEALPSWRTPELPQGHELLLLPDQMYAIAPIALPSLGQDGGDGGDGSGGGGDGGGSAPQGRVLFEIGGPLRDGHGFRRVAAEYSGLRGKATRFRTEVYGPAASANGGAAN